ncbi:MAG: dTMP kinase [Candidatus Ryanbacteria bacterium RIFCSPHIGHO2_02_FULL_48_12]|uniref:Thymidylate kinase n=1 Tax=Candidatus Ryanbacteria bacterium RIFCSPHIGHO2_01_FULL_48_27 TaxID=1802115 RepID=A0A1G2G6B7_9BACT|nr:MAG: dTMP kinase [Candidatus Ryanbacteria bacterium RIFCSPHIGHO2_01_FULL_48_27]OGZ48888.1 MAG: dTMP kinase [Candidatus Ryanbacteria bacterium RIFCSPHIGHO2_02_FULL_48_12]
MPVAKQLSKGLFIAVEGGEGSGKDTQIGYLVPYLESLGFTVVQTFEPGAMEPDVRTRALLHKLDPAEQVRIFSAERKRHVAELIRPALQAGKVVVCNRFKDSMTAYQGYGYGVSLEELEAASHEACGKTVPDLVLYLDVEPRIGLARVKRRGETITTFEAEKIVFHKAVQTGFLALALRNADRWRIVDANRPIDEVWAQTKAHVDLYLARHNFVTK